MGAYSIDPATCVGCTLCARNCPVKAIAGKVKEPHVIDPSVCVGCGACGRLCPKGAVRNDRGEEVQKVPKAEWPKPAVNDAVCAASCGAKRPRSWAAPMGRAARLGEVHRHDKPPA